MTSNDSQDGPRYPPALTRAARTDLKRWAAVYRQRDAIVRQASSAGIGVNEIARVTGLAKTTVLRILADRPAERAGTVAQLPD